MGGIKEIPEDEAHLDIRFMTWVALGHQEMCSGTVIFPQSISSLQHTNTKIDISFIYLLLIYIKVYLTLCCKLEKLHV